MRSSARIEIGTAPATPAQLGRPLMSDHNLSARVWGTAALLSVPFASASGLGWWLPLHMALLGAVTQAIVGGQLMFTTTLGLSRGPTRRSTVTQLALLNAATVVVICGRLFESEVVLAAGATVFTAIIGGLVLQVHRMWRVSVNRRFSITGTFYRLAGISLLMGASIGGALGIGAFNDASSYLAHRGVHMTLNVFGWAGMTIVGTAITLLPTILHVRAPKLRPLKAVPWLMFVGLMVMATGATTDLRLVTALGMGSYLAGLAAFGIFLKNAVTTPSRRKIPTAAFHLLAAVTWAVITTVGLVILSAGGNWAAARDLVVVGGAAGFAFQALLGAWSFLLPSARQPLPQRRRVELVAMEVGGRAQVVLYNIGLVATLFGLRSGTGLSLVGVSLTWVATASALTKSWCFPMLAHLPAVQRRAAKWWADPEKGSK